MFAEAWRRNVSAVVVVVEAAKAVPRKFSATNERSEREPRGKEQIHSLGASLVPGMASARACTTLLEASQCVAPPRNLVTDRRRFLGGVVWCACCQSCTQEKSPHYSERRRAQTRRTRVAAPHFSAAEPANTHTPSHATEAPFGCQLSGGSNRLPEGQGKKRTHLGRGQVTVACITHAPPERAVQMTCSRIVCILYLQVIVLSLPNNKIEKKQPLRHVKK